MRFKIGDVLDIGMGEPFHHNDVNYPPNWTALATADDMAAIGMEAYEPPAPPPQPDPIPPAITRRQCAIELRERGQITALEALAMTRDGTPPAMVAALFAQMPGDAGIIAETDFAAATYMRDNPLLVQLMQANGADDATIDDFFRAAAAR